MDILTVFERILNYCLSFFSVKEIFSISNHDVDNLFTIINIVLGLCLGAITSYFFRKQN